MSHGKVVNAKLVNDKVVNYNIRNIEDFEILVIVGQGDNENFSKFFFIFQFFGNQRGSILATWGLDQSLFQEEMRFIIFEFLKRFSYVRLEIYHTAPDSAHPARMGKGNFGWLG